MNDIEVNSKLSAEEINKLESKKIGRIVLITLLGFFLVVACVDAVFVYKALKSNSGLVVENPYEMGLNYNEIIEQARELKENEHNSKANSSAE